MGAGRGTLGEGGLRRSSGGLGIERETKDRIESGEIGVGTKRSRPGESETVPGSLDRGRALGRNSGLGFGEGCRELGGTEKIQEWIERLGGGDRIGTGTEGSVPGPGAAKAESRTRTEGDLGEMDPGELGQDLGSPGQRSSLARSRRVGDLGARWGSYGPKTLLLGRARQGLWQGAGPRAELQGRELRNGSGRGRAGREKSQAGELLARPGRAGRDRGEFGNARELLAQQGLDWDGVGGEGKEGGSDGGTGFGRGTSEERRRRKTSEEEERGAGGGRERKRRGGEEKRKKKVGFGWGQNDVVLPPGIF